MILRGSYSETIGRPGWADIQGGRTLDRIVRVDGGTGSQGDPNLKPLQSENFDLSAEWYFAESSYASVGYFRKNIKNYIGTEQIIDVGGSDGQTPFNLHTPVGGAYWNAAIGSGCATTDVVCIRNFIFANFDGQPGVDADGTPENGNTPARSPDCRPIPWPASASRRPRTPRTRRSMAGNSTSSTSSADSGFGVATNYTIVDSPNLNYNNYQLGGQFALVGLSDSANLVVFYENYDWSVRAAYNWRDEFLSGLFDGSGIPNPNYIEAYGQLDLSIGYKLNEHLSFQFEAINLTDETIRIHGRNEHQLLYATQNGPRYMFGVRYNF